MEVSGESSRRRVLGGMLMSAGGFLAWSVSGCGSSSSDTPVDLTPDAKKSLDQAKMPPNPFVKSKPKGTSGKPK
jgi:hypothetical protein